jgi:predicted Ser/Thr protein kinase
MSMTTSQVAHYTVERELGRGAMGVVFLARDTRLGRHVAIKALPAELREDAARRARFEDEARTLAAINHPNIAAIYGIEDVEGSGYIVLEFVEGQTLADRLWDAGKDGLPLREAIEVSRQIALGLDAAHQRGIVHRDLKPENVKIRPDGVVKVLDFGIAMTGPVELGPAPASAVTVVVPPRLASTQMGAILGTPGYMSPEQARGKPVGRPTDVWSLGCVLYECLTGRLAFPGETLADSIAATLLMDPDWSALPAKTPGRVVSLLRRCLDKDHRKRSADIGEARAELERAIGELTGVGQRERLSIQVEPETGDEWDDQPASLPAATGAFVGREHEVDEAAAALKSSRLVTLAGVGGSGTTALALRLAKSEGAAFPGGVWWAVTPPVADRGFVARAVATALGARSRVGSGEDAAAALRQALVNRIAARSLLLVLDGCHHNAAACADLAASLLQACPNLRVLATAREPLGPRGERVVEVGGLATAEAAALFAQAGIASSSAWTAAETDGVYIDSLCSEVRGLPLPIMLAAGALGGGTVSALGVRLDERLHGVGASRLGAQPADQIVKLVAAWIFDGLLESDRGLLRRLSLFAGPFTVRAAAAVSGAADSFPSSADPSPLGGPVTQTEERVRDQLLRLAARGLVNPPGDDADARAARLTLPGPVRELVRARLLEASGAVAVARRHAQYWLALADQALPRLEGDGGAAWIVRLEAEHASIQGMAEFAASTRDSETADRLQALLEKFRAVRGL